MNIKVLRKSVTAVSVACVVLSAILGILLLFDAFEATNIIGNIFLTMLIVFIAGLFLLNSLEAISKKNILGIVSACLIVLSAILFFFAVWIEGLMDGIYGKTVALLSAVSIFLNYLVSNYLKLGKNGTVLQVFAYITLFYIELAFVFLIFGNSALFELWQVLVTVCIVFIALTFILKFKLKSVKASGSDSKEGTVKLSVEEYESMKSEIAFLKEKLKKYEN